MDGKQYNTERRRWEIDGEPVTYRVSWRNIDTGENHVREFTDVDQGYSFFEMMRRDAHSIGAVWEHLPY